jgi:hypothetical protein
MSYKPTPITARILKTTKGGVTQPILNMGAPVKMKAPSPNKQVGTIIYQGTKQAVKKSFPVVKKYVTEIIKKATKTKVPSVKKPIKTINVKANAPKGKPKTTKYTTGQKIVGGALATAAVVGAGDTDKKVTPTPNTTPNTTPKKGKSYDQAYKDRDKKVYGGMDKTSYIKEAKRQNASYKKTGKYDVKSSYDKPKAKVANTLKAKKGIDIKKARATSLETKLDPKVLKTQVAKVNSKKVEPSKGDIRKAVRKTKSADRKDSRAARVRQKGIDALASGNTKKALRLKRRETRIKKRATKKRSQAASAIDPTK